MKKYITLLTIVAVIMTTCVFANPIESTVNNQVLSSFNSKFVGAKEVSWNKTEDYIKASFKMNEQAMFAYFTEAGELIGVSRNLVSTQLPLTLQTELKKRSANSWITELFEFASESETAYYLTMETADQKLQLKSNGYNGWSVYKKFRKS